MYFVIKLMGNLRDREAAQSAGLQRLGTLRIRTSDRVRGRVFAGRMTLNPGVERTLRVRVK